MGDPFFRDFATSMGRKKTSPSQGSRGFDPTPNRGVLIFLATPNHGKSPNPQVPHRAFKELTRQSAKK